MFLANMKMGRSKNRQEPQGPDKTGSRTIHVPPPEPVPCLELCLGAASSSRLGLAGLVSLRGPGNQCYVSGPALLSLSPTF